MMMVKRKINIFLSICLLVSIMTISIPSNAYACSCVEPISVQDELSRSEAVFSGRVIEVKEERTNGYLSNTVLFEISEVWKGGSESQIIIRTGGGGGDCGIQFKEGEDYLVYAKSSSMYGDREELVTIICDRTSVLAQAAEDLTILGEGKAPTEQVDLSGELNSISSNIWMTALGIVLIVLVAFLVGRRVRKK
ncbi:LPXTG cell wall anchor domain-containing protein [Paenibacillus polygoni]|uniref:LPXTG cell wall anchor domain-containing protein n=1 Tax=Paenibacillus polygoni TaxID=3050112 RepID=A0ABY8X1R0_9BACL|nr:LPXTG cell wall anchor domain-containing protein [Paenibacillus polygoni]WIV17381.1 LPXTG cell wall anchor domain-containing protein [Paenibacillus polygoni]